MIEIFGFIQLDDHNGIAQCADLDGTRKWYLFTFDDEIYNHSVTLSHNSHFTFSEIDPDNFVWNGVRVRMEVNR